MPHLLRLLFGIDARRPAAWLGLAVAAAGAVVLADVGGALGPVAAVVLGGVGAVMAVGQVPVVPGRRGPDLFWCALRAAWPLAGWATGAVVGGDPAVAAGGAVGIVAAAALGVGCLRLGLVPADAVSAVLVAVAAAGAAGWWNGMVRPESPRAGLLAATVVLGLANAILWGGGGRRVVGWSAPRGRARQLLTGAAMASAVAGMVGWLLLADDRAGFDLAASLAWFIALAVPAATLGDGVSHTPAWRRLERSMPRVSGSRLRLTPGRYRESVVATLVNAAILGWPPLVAATVSGAAWPAAAIVGALAAAAALLLAITWLGDSCGTGTDTAQAVVLACGCAALAAALAWAAGKTPSLPFLPISGPAVRPG